jgi:hypothetical protein
MSVYCSTVELSCGQRGQLHAAISVGFWTVLTVNVLARNGVYE